MSEAKSMTVEEGIEELRRLHATGQIDTLVAIAIGPDPNANLHVVCADKWEEPGRGSDPIRLLGLLSIMEAKIAMSIRSRGVKHGPRGIV